MLTQIDLDHLPADGGSKYNRLIFEKSPYLLQHAQNPVDWYPWGDAAFAKARKEDKPIFLSIGYSTCHWCHVMEHESFEDAEVANLLNEVFVAIKVDREERPDIDNIYMTVCQLLTGGGGWPLTIIMTPDKKPFFAGTYFPKTARYGRLGMMELIPRIKEMWSLRRNELLQNAEQITKELSRTEESTGEKLTEVVLDRAYADFKSRFDEEFGGFGSAPKFPSPHNLLFLLRYWHRNHEDAALKMVETTLTEMRRGGLYDHLGFGFHRYSTDRHWLVPHFEKMLYDQAMLAMAYVEAFQATKNPMYSRTAQEIFKYVSRDMTDPKGGFYSAEDADSEGEEGKFYLWTEDEIRELLDEANRDIFLEAYNCKSTGNFKGQATGETTGANILHLHQPLSRIAEKYKITSSELENRLYSARKTLLTAREKRIRPHRDDKILTDWNGLMVAALAKGAQVFPNSTYGNAAQKTVDFIMTNMRDDKGRLLHRYRDGEADIAAHADDYAFLIWGLLELYEAIFEVKYLEFALELTTDFIDHFWDETNGGFFFTANDGEKLLMRQKQIYDGAVPSANSVAALNLLRLARITGNADFEYKSNQIIMAFAKQVKQIPVAHAQLLSALAFGLGPSFEVVIAGNRTLTDTQAMISALRERFSPNKILLFVPNGDQALRLNQIAAFTKYQISPNGKATAYVCVNQVCNNPTQNIDEMLAMIK